MKISTYITIAFVLFFFGIITALHIDSKRYEPDYKIIQEIRSEAYKVVRSNKLEELDVEKWNNYISKADKFFSLEKVFPYEINSSAWFVYGNYKKYNDLEALNLAKSWCEKAYKVQPESLYITDTFACILFDLGYVERAVELETFAVKKAIEEKHHLLKWYKPRLEKFEKALQEQTSKEQ